MANMLQSGVAWLRDQLEAHAGVTFVYRIGNLASAPLTGTLGQSLHRVGETASTAVVRTDRDLLTDPAKLILGGQVQTPARGHRVEITIAGKLQVFEVQPPFDGEPVSRMEPTGQLMRIHMAKVK